VICSYSDCKEGRRAGLGNGPNASTAACAVASPGMVTLPFVDISFCHFVSSLSILTSLFCPRIVTRTHHKYRRTGLVESQQRGPGRSRGVPLFPPFIFASSAATCSNERAGHTGHLYYFLPDAAVLSSSLTQPHFSSLPGFGTSYPCSVIYPSYELF
jgi:hypothetical protein